ncbi:MAG TPA: DUF6089 family protein [Cyclobacteriaceae bacterium]
MRKGILLFFALTPLVAISQTFYAVRKERSLIFVGGIGTASYFGDLKDPGDLIDAKPSVSAGLQFYFTPRISVRSELTYFNIKGDDASSSDPTRQRRNLSFTSGNFELNAVGIVDLFPLGRRFYQRPGVNFYGLAGIGAMYMNPKAEYNGQKYALQPLRTEDVSYSRFQFVIPYGIGMRFKAGPFFNIGIESVWRKTFTDYLDDVSTVHPDKSGWNDPIRIALSDRRVEGNPELEPYPVGARRGDPSDDDVYHLLLLKVEYYLPDNFLFKDPYKKLYNTRRKPYYQ